MASEPVRHVFADDGIFPNSKLPVLVYRRASAAPAAAAFEQMFDAHHWSSAWRNGLFSVHHYHSTAHEVLGIYQGWVRAKLGGEKGTLLTLEAGDVIVIPAGVAHKNEGASPHLVVVGAYPGGKGPDMCSPGAHVHERALRNVREVPLPASDPVYGKSGPLIERWRAVNRG
jgi:uncharacterized protein YjlB